MANSARARIVAESSCNWDGCCPASGELHVSATPAAMNDRALGRNRRQWLMVPIMVLSMVPIMVLSMVLIMVRCVRRGTVVGEDWRKGASGMTSSLARTCTECKTAPGNLGAVLSLPFQKLRTRNAP
jgi:hypothetical protein